MVFTFEEDAILAKFMKGAYWGPNTSKTSATRSDSMTEKMWSEIADKLNKNVDECKIRWKWIEKSYFNESAAATGAKEKINVGKLIVSALSKGLADFKDWSWSDEEEKINAGPDDAAAATVDFGQGPSKSTFVPANKRKEPSPSESVPKKKSKRVGNKVFFRKSTEKLLRVFLKRNKKLLKFDIENDVIVQYFLNVAYTVKTFSPMIKIQSKMVFAQTLFLLEFQNEQMILNSSRQDKAPVSSPSHDSSLEGSSASICDETEQDADDLSGRQSPTQQYDDDEEEEEEDIDE